MVHLLAQNVVISLPVALTFGGVIGLIYLVIKVGDRLWARNGRGQDKNTPCTNPDALERLGSSCQGRSDKLVENMSRLSDAMTKYIELQQAALKIEEYRHGNIIKQLEVLSGKVDHVDEKRSKDIAALHQRLDGILTSIANREMVHVPKSRSK